MPIEYEVFEGKGIVRKPKKKKDKEFFNNIKEKLGFNNDIDFATFCTAIAIYKKYNNEPLDMKDKPSLKEMAKMYSFDKKKLYDFIILSHLEVEEKRLEEFEKYFYAGFELLKEWFEEYGPDTNTEIERLCSIWDYVFNS